MLFGNLLDLLVNIVVFAGSYGVLTLSKKRLEMVNFLINKNFLVYVLVLFRSLVLIWFSVLLIEIYSASLKLNGYIVNHVTDLIDSTIFPTFATWWYC